MESYEELAAAVEAIRKLPPWLRRERKDELDERIEEAEYGFDPITYQQAQRLYQTLHSIQ
jgi:hypothetical protein